MLQNITMHQPKIIEDSISNIKRENSTKKRQPQELMVSIINKSSMRREFIMKFLFLTDEFTMRITKLKPKDITESMKRPTSIDNMEVSNKLKKVTTDIKTEDPITLIIHKEKTSNQRNNNHMEKRAVWCLNIQAMKTMKEN